MIADLNACRGDRNHRRLSETQETSAVNARHEIGAISAKLLGNRRSPSAVQRFLNG